jgi:hypothetical protein
MPERGRLQTPPLGRSARSPMRRVTRRGNAYSAMYRRSSSRSRSASHRTRGRAPSGTRPARPCLPASGVAGRVQPEAEAVAHRLRRHIAPRTHHLAHPGQDDTSGKERLPERTFGHGRVDATVTAPTRRGPRDSRARRGPAARPSVEMPCLAFRPDHRHAEARARGTGYSWRARQNNGRLAHGIKLDIVHVRRGCAHHHSRRASARSGASRPSSAPSSGSRG